MMKKKQLPFFYGWIVFGVCFLMELTALGFCSSVKSLYLAPITEDLQISRSLFSIGDSFRYVTTAVVNLFFGVLILKWKPRGMAAAGFIALALSCLLNSFAQNVFFFYAGGILLGLGLAWCTTTLVGYIVGKWFTNSKGTVMGIILAANGLGAAAAAQILSPIIYDPAGVTNWRTSYLVCAILMLVVGPIVVLLLRNAPEDVGQLPAGTDKTAKARRGSDWCGIPLREARKKPYFYLALLCVFLTGLLLQSATSISSAHMKDVGIDPDFIAAQLSIHSVILAFAKIYTGFSFDKFGLRVTILFSSICTVVFLLLLAFVNGPVMAVIYSVVSSFALPLETVMLPLIALDLFGNVDFSAAMGLIVSANTAGYAVGSPVVNVIYDLTGSYKSVLLVFAVLMAVVTVCMQFVISAAAKTRNEILAQQGE